MPAGVSSLSHDMETEVFHSLVKELNDKLGLKLDPTTNLDREVEVGGAAGPSPVLVVGLAMLQGLQTLWRCMRQKASVMADLVQQVLVTVRPSCVVVFQILDSIFHFAKTEEGGLNAGL